jgi:hypothetical protein
MNQDENYISYLKGLPKDEQETEVQDKISEFATNLLDAEEVSSEMAGSNASGWGPDTEPEVLDIDFNNPNEARVKIAFILSGNQNDDQSYMGTSIEGHALAIIDFSGCVRFANVTAKRDMGNDDDEPE